MLFVVASLLGVLVLVLVAGNVEFNAANIGTKSGYSGKLYCIHSEKYTSGHW